MNLVITADARAVRCHNERRIVIAPLLPRRIVVPADVTHHQRSLHGVSNANERLLELWVCLIERRGRLRPSHQIGMRRIRRADDFSHGSAGLGNSGNIGLALFAGQAREFGNMLLPFAGA